MLLKLRTASKAPWVSLASLWLPLIGFFFIVASMKNIVVAAETEQSLPYCDLEYRITAHGTVRDVKILACEPENLFPKYRTRSKRLIGKLSFEPKTVDGRAVETKEAKVRVIFQEKILPRC